LKFWTKSGLLTEQVKLIWVKKKIFDLLAGSFFTGLYHWIKTRGEMPEKALTIFIYYRTLTYGKPQTGIV
jgi:hypothetical protein